MRWAVPLLLAALTSGCYSYVRADGGSVAPGERIRVELTDRGTADLASLIGPGAVAIEGRVVDGAGEDLGLAVAVVELRSGIENYWKGERVAIPPDAVARFERRRFSRTRTAFAAGLTLVAGLVAVQVLGPASDGSTGDSGGGGPPSQ